MGRPGEELVHAGRRLKESATSRTNHFLAKLMYRGRQPFSCGPPSEIILYGFRRDKRRGFPLLGDRGSRLFESNSHPSPFRRPPLGA